MKRLLVVDFDGVVLRGAVARVDRRGTVEFLAHAVSTAATPEAALEEISRALGRTPAACVVRTAEAVAGLVRLPIASARGRDPAEIAQMLFWELEPIYAQQTMVRPVGAILLARRHLERAQVERILAVQKERRALGIRDAASVRFGAVARELGYVTDQQLAEALAIQERLGRTEEDHVCGWAAQGPVQGGGLWLAVGMPAARRRSWAERLAARGLKLLAIYPRLPSATAALDGRASATLIEAEPHAVSRSVVRQGALASLEVAGASDAEPPAAICREFLDGTNPSETFVCGSLAEPAWVDALGRPVTLFEPPLRGDVARPATAWAGLAGAARHAAGRGGAIAAVPARDPGPPLLSRPAVRWAAAVLLVASAAICVDRLAARSLARSVRELAEARERLQRLTGEVRDAERRGADAGALTEEIAALEEQRGTLLARLRMLDEGVAARSRLLPRLLDALAAAASEEILLDRVTEESPGRIRIEGRALSERSVQAFLRSVAARVLPLRLRVADQAIRKESPRTPGGHYTFSFLLEPLPKEDA